MTELVSTERDATIMVRGRTQAQHEVDVRAEVEGVVQAIHFEKGEFAIDDLWNRLCAQGYAMGPSPRAPLRTSISADNLGGDRLGRAMVSAVVEAVVQHSAQALVRALL